MCGKAVQTLSCFFVYYDYFIGFKILVSIGWFYKGYFVLAVNTTFFLP
jgi:hypothetical protein